VIKHHVLTVIVREKVGVEPKRTLAIVVGLCLVIDPHEQGVPRITARRYEENGAADLPQPLIAGSVEGLDDIPVCLWREILEVMKQDTLKPFFTAEGNEL
jgi:hypothetical protein